MRKELVLKINYKGVTVSGTPSAIVQMMAGWSWDGYPTNEEYRKKVGRRIGHLYSVKVDLSNDFRFIKSLEKTGEVEVLQIEAE
jgi:hypothetical protein